MCYQWGEINEYANEGTDGRGFFSSFDTITGCGAHCAGTCFLGCISDVFLAGIVSATLEKKPVNPKFLPFFSTTRLS
jgi:hypothetical protein